MIYLFVPGHGSKYFFDSITTPSINFTNCFIDKIYRIGLMVLF